MALNIPTKNTGDSLTATEFNDLVNEAKKIDNKVDKAPGKGLSTNDYTNDDKNKLSGLSNYDDTALNDRVSTVESRLESVTGSVVSFSESEVGTLKYAGKDYTIFELSAELSGIPSTAGQSVDVVLSDNPLGNELYLNVTCLSIATSGGFKPSSHDVSSVHVDANMNTVVTIKCNEPVTGLQKVILTIRYVKGMLSFDTFTLSMPKSELGIAAEDDVSVVFPSLKYDKKFAFAWTTDDSILGIYSLIFKYINKKYIDDTYNFHDGMTPTTGFTPDRVLCSTDGCGNDVRFRVDSGWVSFNNNGSDGIHSDSYPYQYVRWSELITFLDFFNTIMNHGGGDQGKPLASIQANADKLVEKCGINPFLLLVPGGTTGFQGTAETLDYIYHYHDKLNLDYSTDALTRESFKVKHGLLGRRTYDGMTLDELCSLVDSRAVRTDHPFTYVGGHVVADTNEQIKWTAAVKPFLDYLHDTYGKGGNDTIWFAGPSEIYEYLFTRYHSVITKKINGDNLDVTVKIARLPLFYQNEFSLLVKTMTAINTNVSTLTINKEVMKLSRGLKDGNLLINVNYNPKLLELAEKYTSKHELSSLEVDKEDALYFANLLNDDLKAPFLARINSGDTAPVLNSISVNSGSTTTYNQEVSVSLNVTGSISHYRVSESADLSSVAWIEGTSRTINFNLSSQLGLKTLHVQVKNSFGESGIQSSSITLVERPSVTYTVTARSNNTALGSVSPSTQEVEEGGGVVVTANATGGNVIDNWDGVDSGTGVGTASGEGRVLNVRENRNVTCNFKPLVTGNVKIILHPVISPGVSTLPGGEKISGIRGSFSTTHPRPEIFDTSGNLVGHQVASQDMLPEGIIDLKLSTNTNPVLSGDTGTYPDSFLGSLYGTYSLDTYPTARGLLRLELPEGTYTIRVLYSTQKVLSREQLTGITYDANGVVATLPASYSATNNNSEFLEINNVIVDSDGILDMYMGSTTPWIRAGWNLVEIIKQ